MMSGEHGLFFGGGFVMWLFWIAIIIGLVYIVKSIIPGGSSGNTRSENESPKEILDKRLARGEINAEEYKRLRDELEK